MQTIFLLGSIDVQFIDAMRTLIERIYSNAFRSQFNRLQISKGLFDIEMEIDPRKNKKFPIADHKVNQHKSFGNDGQKFCSLFHGTVVELYDSLNWCVNIFFIFTKI